MPSYDTDFVDAAYVAPCTGATLVRTGVLSAFVVERDGQRVLVAPLAYDLDIVLSEGEKVVAEGADLLDAVTDWYIESFDAWCVRKRAERDAVVTPEPTRRSTSGGTPTYDGAGRFVPFSWMGRHPSFVR